MPVKFVVLRKIVLWVVIKTRTCVGRNGVVGDLQGAALFLSSPASDYITGQTLFVDGGFTAK